MGLSEKLKLTEPTHSGLPCGMGRLLASLNAKDREALNDVLFQDATAGFRMSNTRIYQVLVEEGYQVAPSSVAQHRRKQCRCFIGAHLSKKDK